MKMRALPFLILLFFTGCASISYGEAENRSTVSGRYKERPESYREPESLNKFVNHLTSMGRNWRMHGIYIETLDGGEPVAMLNEDARFNPASVTKLATTLAALDRLGNDHRFRTEFRTDGQINAATGELNGDLVLLSGRDPSFSISDAERVGEAVRNAGIQRINGRLIVVGDFSCNLISATSASAEIFRRSSKLQFRNPTSYLSYSQYIPRGRSLITVESDTLVNIVQYLNAHSINTLAELLASHIGGAEGVRRFLIEKIGMPEDSVFISRASGLEVNRLTPRETVRMIRAMVEWLSKNELRPASVMAVAGVDAGTLRGRFTESGFAGSVVAKTGTLHTTDSGVAALAGVIYTRKRGPLLFAVYDGAENQNVQILRRAQDEFLKQIINECGGPVSIARFRIGRPQDKPQSHISFSD